MSVSEYQPGVENSILSPLQASEIRNYLNSLDVEDINSIEVLASVTSTNDYLLKQKYIEKNDIAVCVAEEQTHGRGRFGHQWYSPKGVNLYFSLLWPFKQWHQHYETLGLFLLITIAEKFEQLTLTDIRLKWPNDICVNEKKLGGILIDRKPFKSIHNVVIGVGINVAMSTIMLRALEKPWTDLISVKPDWQMSRNELAAQIISSLTKTLTNLEIKGQLDLPSMWSPYDLMYKRKIEFTYASERRIGTALGIDQRGQIIIDMDGQKSHLHSTHVSDITL